MTIGYISPEGGVCGTILILCLCIGLSAHGISGSVDGHVGAFGGQRWLAGQASISTFDAFDGGWCERSRSRGRRGGCHRGGVRQVESLRLRPQRTCEQHMNKIY